MEQYIAEELKEDIKYLIKKVTELINKEKVNNKMDKKKKNIIKLLDRFDWAAIGVAACGIILFIHLVIKLKG